MTSSFFWHDYETFGRSPRRDRPAQFAGIRTDLELNDLEEPVTMLCAPADDHVPDVEACLLTGIVPQDCESQGISERAFAAEVSKHLSRQDTIGVGFNSSSFDDEVTRFLMWRNLMDPYGREWRNGCSRWDLLGVLRCAYALRPEGVVWPTTREGRPTFRLQDLSAANAITHDAAHDALSDVRATIALARLVRAAQPQLWAFCLKLRDRAFVSEQLGGGGPLLHVSSLHPAERGCLAVVWPMGPHPRHSSEVIVWDLAHDPTELLSLTAAEIRQRLFVRNDDLPPGTTRLPLTTIHLKKSPIVVQNIKTLRPAQASKWGIDVDKAHRHAEVARSVAPRMSGVWRDVYGHGSGPREPTDVDEALYSGFLRDDDAQRLARLRALSAAALAADRTDFADARLDELVFRYRARNHPETLTEEERSRWLAHRRARLLDGAHGARRLADLEQDVARLRPRADARANRILDALEAWGRRLGEDVRAEP